MENTNPADLIALDKYPITQLESEAGQTLLANCYQQLKITGACTLPAFIKPQAIAAMAKECQSLDTFARRSSSLSNPYTREEDLNLSSGHPRRRKFPTCIKTLAYDQIPTTTQIRQLYEWTSLTDFIGSILQIKLHRFADEFQALNITLMEDGDQLCWHYDLSDFVVTLLLQKSQQGGEFEFAPMIRDLEDSDYSHAQRLFAGDYDKAQVVSHQAGTLVIFQGLKSLHRVRAVYGAINRITAILSYDTKPNFKSTDNMNIALYGPRVQEILKKRKQVL